ncbi:MAG: hypothetical protein AAGF32_02730 [Pseudomonadota bacterium]
MATGSRIFVLVIFGVLAASFIYTSYQLFAEFGPDLGTDLAAYYAHLFVFFPTLGIIALIAFYTPACIFVDMYWTHVPGGKLRFIVGFAVVGMAAFAISDELTGGSERSLFEVAPERLRGDNGAPGNCAVNRAPLAQSTPLPTGSSGGPALNGPALVAGQGSSALRYPPACQRVPVLTALENIRSEASKRSGLRVLQRNCTPDLLLQDPPERSERRFCFASNVLPGEAARYRTADECCTAQRAMATYVSTVEKTPGGSSQTATVHKLLLPGKVFFLLVMLTIGVLLAARQASIRTHYARYARSLQRGVLIGAAAMVLWPLMNHAFLQASGVLYGNTGQSLLRTLSPMISLLFAAWTLMLIYYFFEPEKKTLETVGKIGGLVSAGVAFVTYNELVNYIVQFAGAGATVWSLGALTIICLVLIVGLLWPKRRARPDPKPT